MKKQYDFSEYKKLHVYWRLLLFVRQYWLAFTLGIFGTVLGSITSASFTWLLKPVLDRGFVKHDLHFIRTLPFLILGAFLLRGIANFLSDYYMTWAGRQVVMRFRQEMFQHLLKMPAEFYDQISSGQLLSTLIYNVDQLARASTDALVTTVRETFFIFGLAIVMVINSWQLSLIFLVVIPLIATTARYANKRMRQLSRSLQESMAETTQIAQEAIEGYQVVRIFGGQQYEYNKFEHVTENNRSREVKVTITNSIASSLVQLVAGLAIAAIIVFATSHSLHITAGSFAALLAAMLSMLKPMKNLTNVSGTIQKGIAAAESVFALLDKPAETDHGTTKLAHANGNIELKNISFIYPRTEHIVLENFSLKIPAGKTTAIVGRSGSGKSTLVKLLPHFYDHYQGEIFLDDVNLKDITLSSLREQIALVSQQITLFNDTIANNIAYGTTAASMDREAIIHAAKAAYAHDFITALPQGYDTLVGENGVLLSGGQRQRLAIARAMLKDAPILILDEATSALDSESELYIQQALVDLIKNRTTIVIAHRLSTVENADQIIVLDHGKVIEQGKHQDLLAQNGHYAKLYRVQFKQ